jgi:hypothetical protein
MKRSLAFVLLLCMTGILMGASLFKCKEVHSHAEMAEIRLGLPIPFLAVNMQRYTPLEYPQCFRVGSPWEDPMRMLWPAFLANLLIIFAALYGFVVVLSHAVRRKNSAR